MDEKETKETKPETKPETNNIGEPLAEVKEEPKASAPSPVKAPQKPVPAEAPRIRVFVYDQKEYDDPDPKMTPDEVRLSYVTFFPELANAEIIPAKNREPNQVIIEFRRRTGTKGAKKETPKEEFICWNCKQPGMKQVPGQKPGWMKCPVCGTTDVFVMPKEVAGGTKAV